MRGALILTLCLGTAAPAVAQEAAAPASPQPQPPLKPSGTVLKLRASEAARRAVNSDLRARAARSARDAVVARTREVLGFYDPIVFTSLENRQDRSEASSAFSGASIVRQDELALTLGVGKTFMTGTNVRLEWINARSDTNSAFANFAPAYSTALRLTATQPLLRDFGLDYHQARLESAERQRAAADLNLRSTLSDLALAAERLYWQLVLARLEFDVARTARDNAAEQLRLVEAQRQVGRLAPVDVLQARAGLATQEEFLILAETETYNAQDRLLQVVAPPAEADDLDAWDVTIATEQQAGGAPGSYDLRARVTLALAKRPEVLAAREGEADARLQVRLADRSWLPRLDLVGSVSSNGLGTTPAEAGEDLGRGDFLGWSLGLQFEWAIAIPNSAGASRLSAAEATRDERRLRVRDVETVVVLEVRQAVRVLQASDRRIASARAAREFTQSKLATELERLRQGLSTAFLVSQAREELQRAQLREAQALVDFQLADAALRRADGSILDGLLDQPGDPASTRGR
ncbi:MAG: TolC family protein [Planctomycetota bacterium]|jgi:outer membrane protein TolC